MFFPDRVCFVLSLLICSVFTEASEIPNGSDLPISNGSTMHESCSPFPKDCADIETNGGTETGIYYIFPEINGRPVQVYCDMETDGGGWLVFQQRLDDSVDFYRGWDQYKKGFGDIGGNFWLGNDLISRITSRGNYELRVDMEDFEREHRYAHYSDFKVNSEEDNYKLTLGVYSGNAGDSLTNHREMPFSTKDRDHDIHGAEHCAVRFKGAWWYEACHKSNLNGLYLIGPHESFADGVNWYPWKGHYYSLKSTAMKIRPVN